MKRSVLIALVIALAATAWILSGQIGGTSGAPQPAATGRPAAAEAALPAVRVQRFEARDHLAQRSVTGRTEAARRVEVRAETTGPIAEVLVREGARVETDEPIARIAPQDREARLAEAEALVAQREVELDAAEQLSEKGWRATTQLAASQAQYDEAAARLKQIQVEIAQTTIRAPFDGVLEDRAVEVGTYVDRGDEIATIVDLDPVLVVGEVNETDVGALAVGTPGQARLVTGETVKGRIRFISAVANPDTRTFRVELEVANADGLVRAGLTSELLLPGRSSRAHLVPPALLTLGDDGRVGVKAVEDGVVHFLPVTILGDARDGVWLAGLPETAILITVGQEFVKDGQRVEAVAAPETTS